MTSGSGTKWKNKVTKPKAPSFMKEYFDQMNSIHHHNDQSSLALDKTPSSAKSKAKKALKGMIENTVIA